MLPALSLTAVEILQVQALPPVFYQGESTPAAAPGYAESCQLAVDAFQRAVDVQPDEWVLHLYLGKACAPGFSSNPRVGSEDVAL